MGKIQHKDAINTFIKIGLFSGSLLITALAVYFYSPVISSHADTSAPENVDVRLNIKPTIALTTDVSELDLDARLNEFVSGSVNVDVITNSQYGYTLALEDADNDTNMNSTSNDVTDLVTSTFTGSKTSSTMDGNTWGYSLDATNFYKIPVNGSYAVIGNTHVPTPTNPGYNRTTVNFGVKVGSVLTSGTYADTVLFTAYVNGQDYNPLPKTLHSISTMQQMTPAICNATQQPAKTATQFDWDGSHDGDNSYVPRTVLTDTRDNKTYLVSKLADGNCWMSQNLALDVTANTAIISSKNDGTTVSVIPDDTTQTDTGIAWHDSYVDYTDNWRSYKPKATEAYYQGGSNRSSAPTGSGDSYSWEKTGNFYDWHAATAGSGMSDTASSDAILSICPKGWRLPTGEGSKSYSNLYGVYDDIETWDPYQSLADPLNFILPGSYMGDGVIRYWGSGGGYWTATTDEDAEAYILSFSRDGVDSQRSMSKSIGESIRCVAI